jgi:hypothetical protein
MAHRAGARPLVSEPQIVVNARARPHCQAFCPVPRWTGGREPRAGVRIMMALASSELRAVAPAGAAGNSWLRTLGQPAARVLALALLISLVASTQYLFQPFVWRNWPVDEVLQGWFAVIGERATVALAIGASIALALPLMHRVPRAHFVVRTVLFVFMAEAGSMLGEAVLAWQDVPGAATGLADLGARSLRWSVAALAVAGLRLAWLRSLQVQSSMRAMQLARSQAEAQVASLRLQALQAQIEPHFLFNTLATVRRLGGTEPAQCERLLLHLHEFIRLSRVGEPGEVQGRIWTVGEEIELARAYLGVVEMRMDGRLRVGFDVDPGALACEVPPLMLATLVENAVKHGIAPSTAAGEIVVAAHRAGDRLDLSVADSGVGFAKGVSGGTGIGLSNTRARLRTLYGAQAQLSLEARQPSGVAARLQLPAREPAP